MRHPLSLTVITALLLTSATQQSSCGGDDDDSTSPTPNPSSDCTGTYLVEEVNNATQEGFPDPYLAVSCDDDYVTVESNGIPNFEFQQITPNALREQDLRWKIPRSPALASQPSALWYTGPVAISVTGLPMYAPNEAPNDGYGDPYLDGILDYCNGHTDQAGIYHFHARPECLFETIEGKAHLVLGWAFDGFPIVAPFECSNGDCSQTFEVQSSYVYEGDSSNAYLANTYHEGAGDLDECNGMMASDGAYRYYATDIFPYLIGCFSGTPEESNNANGANSDLDPTTDDGGNTGGGTGEPQPCASSNDCTNACPPDAQGCTCSTNPMGDSVCVPTCSQDADCQLGGDVSLTCDEGQGICIPQ